MHQDLTQGSVMRSMLVFAVPMILGNLLQQCYNIADTLIVGQFLGKNALAAVGSSFSLMTFLTSILLGLCMGSGALFSIRFGQRDETGLRESIRASFVLIAAAALALRGEETLPAAGSAAVPASARNWGLSFQTEGEAPVGNATQEYLSQYGAYYLGETDEKVLYLTFDCGYENGYTEKILDALKKHHAPAAFFVVGHMIESAPDVVRRMAAEGHVVGNHTFHHPDMSSISQQEAFRKELDTLADLYQQTTGKPLSHFYRPPQGKYSEENLKQAQALGYKTIFWSLAYVDWNTDKQPSPEQAYAKLLPRIHDGAIVLLHSTSRTNAEILDELLCKWEAMGYTFKSLNELPAA